MRPSVVLPDPDFTGEAKNLAAADCEAHAVHGADRRQAAAESAAIGEVAHHVLHFEQRDHAA